MSQFPRQACDDNPDKTCIALIGRTGQVFQIPDQVRGRESLLLSYRMDGQPLVPESVLQQINQAARESADDPTESENSVVTTETAQPETAVPVTASAELAKSPAQSPELIAAEAFLAEPSHIEFSARPVKTLTLRAKSHSRPLWLAAGLLAAGVVLDAQGTTMAQGRGAKELNSWLFGRTPSPLRMYGTEAAAGVAMIWAIYRLKRRSPNKKYELFPLAASVAHFIAGVHTLAAY